MRFYNRDGELDDQEFQRTWAQERDMALSALDCVLNGDKALYGSSELTTGRRFYELAEVHGAQSTTELRGKLGPEDFQELLWGPNVDKANRFAARLRARTAGCPLVITPAPFVAEGWTQPQYLSFWETLIRSRLEAAYFNDGWWYSNGCTFELAVSLDAGLPVFDHQGNPLEPAEGIQRVVVAVDDLRRRGFNPAILERNLAWLRRLTIRTTPA